MAMPYVFIKWTYPDGGELAIQVAADSSYADALDEARAVAARAFRDALGVMSEESDLEVPEIEEP